MHGEQVHVEITETKGIFLELNMYLADTVFIFECQCLLPSSCLYFCSHESGQLLPEELP